MGFTMRLLRPSQCDRPSGFHASGGTMHLIGARMTGGSEAASALEHYFGARAALYAQLKLAGLAEAPFHLAVFVDEGTTAGHGLGRRTMPETLHYSAVTAVYAFWLTARAYGLGVGWVSILDPSDVTEILEVPAEWSLVAYLCVGYPQEEHVDPELERYGWQIRDDRSRLVLRR